MSFLNPEELAKLGLKSYGKNVLISRDARIYGPENVEMGHDVRIDAFTVLLATKGQIKLGSWIHVSTHCLFIGGGGIELGDFVNIGSHSRLISASDSFHGDWLIGPCVPEDLTDVKKEKITLEKHCVLGSGCTVFPGILMEMASAVGVDSLVNKNLRPLCLYAGVPIRFLKERQQECLNLGDVLEKDSQE